MTSDARSEQMSNETTDTPCWYPLGVLILVALQAAFLTGMSGLSTSNGEIHATWAVPLGQVREAILFAVVIGVVLYYGIPYAGSKLEEVSGRE